MQYWISEVVVVVTALARTRFHWPVLAAGRMSAMRRAVSIGVKSMTMAPSNHDGLMSEAACVSIPQWGTPLPSTMYNKKNEKLANDLNDSVVE